MGEFFVIFISVFVFLLALLGGVEVLLAVIGYEYIINNYAIVKMSKE